MVGTPGETIDPEDFARPVFEQIELDPIDSSATTTIIYPNGWVQYVDNVNIAGGAGSRFWLDAPDQGDIVLGPRAGAAILGHVRIRTPQTTASAANMFINSTSYEIFRSTSSLKYKANISAHDVDLAALRGLRVVTFNDRAEMKAHEEWLARQAARPDAETAEPTGVFLEDDPEPVVRRYVGMIAEEVHDAGLHEFVTYDDATGDPDGLMYDRLTLGVLQLVKQQADRIDDLTARIEQLEARNN